MEQQFEPNLDQVKKMPQKKMAQADGVRDVPSESEDVSASDTNSENTADSKVAKQVRENEDASMQDKSYSFDEDVTDANYDTEDGLNFSDEDSGRK